MSDYIQKLIAQGEHQQLDFKFEISDSKKIARSLVAFANTDGGRLLVGVKDNGAIAGVRSEEEYYMVEAAAQLYCKPEIVFQTKEWEIDGKTVLEIIVPKSRKIKHKAPYKDNDYKIFIRVRDKNILADPILIQLWKREKSIVPVKLSFTDKEMTLLYYLSRHSYITLTEFVEIANISKRNAEKILLDFVLTGVLKMNSDDKLTSFQLIDVEILNHIEPNS
jgi:predicted HTH transcriptional regulator